MYLEILLEVILPKTYSNNKTKRLRRKRQAAWEQRRLKKLIHEAWQDGSGNKGFTPDQQKLNQKILDVWAGNPLTYAQTQTVIGSTHHSKGNKA